MCHSFFVLHLYCKSIILKVVTLASYQEKFVLTENKEGDFHKGKYNI